MESKLKYRKRIIEELQDIPEEEIPKILEIIHYVKEGILSDKRKKGVKKKKELLLDIKDIGIETGIPDLAEHHDHYLYGVPKGE